MAPFIALEAETALLERQLMYIPLRALILSTAGELQSPGHLPIQIYSGELTGFQFS